MNDELKQEFAGLATTINSYITKLVACEPLQAAVLRFNEAFFWLERALGVKVQADAQAAIEVPASPVTETASESVVVVEAVSAPVAMEEPMTVSTVQPT